VNIFFCLYQNKMYCAQENQRWVVSISDSPKPPSERITFTFPVLQNARCVIFAACGSSKAEIVKVSTTLFHEKTITLDNDRNRNVKSERILTKLRVLDYEYIYDRIAKFHKKIFITRVINIQILTTKYFSFQYSVTYCSQAFRRPAHRARETVHLLTPETPDFITLSLWPANSPDLNPVDYQI